MERHRIPLQNVGDDGEGRAFLDGIQRRLVEKSASRRSGDPQVFNGSAPGDCEMHDRLPFQPPPQRQPGIILGFCDTVPDCQNETVFQRLQVLAAPARACDCFGCK